MTVRVECGVASDEVGSSTLSVWSLPGEGGCGATSCQSVGQDHDVQVEPVREQVNSTAHRAEEEEVVVQFDSCATQYEETVDRSVSFTGRDSVFFAKRKVEVLEEILRPELGPLRSLSVLDVGCGTGTTDRLFRPRVGSLHGVDISEEMLAKARHHVPDTEYRWYDGEKLPFPDESFDVVVTICVLHHVPISRRFKFVSEMVRVTRARGVVAVFEHNPMNPLTRRAVNSCEFDNDAVLLTCDESLAMLRDAAETPPRVRHYLFTPFGGPFGRVLDRRLNRLPFGGQYVAWVRQTRPSKGRRRKRSPRWRRVSRP